MSNLIAILDQIRIEAGSQLYSYELMIRSAAERQHQVGMINGLWMHFSESLHPDCIRRLYAGAVEFEVGTHNVGSVAILLVDEPRNELLIRLEFSFSYSCAPLDFNQEFDRFDRLWQEVASCSERPVASRSIEATIRFDDRRRSHRYAAPTTCARIRPLRIEHQRIATNFALKKSWRHDHDQ